MITYQPDYNDQGHRPDQREGAYKVATICVIAFFVFMLFFIATSCSKPDKEDCYACTQTIAGSQTTVIYFDVCDVSEQDITALERKVNCKCVKIK